MYNLYHVKLKIGKRTWTEKNYFNNPEDVKSFYQNVTEAEVMEIQQLVTVYTNTSKTQPVDDPNSYQPTTYMLVSNNDKHRSTRVILQTIKLKHSISDVLEYMKLYVKINKDTSIKSLLTASISSK